MRSHPDRTERRGPRAAANAAADPRICAASGLPSHVPKPAVVAQRIQRIEADNSPRLAPLNSLRQMIRESPASTPGWEVRNSTRGMGSTAGTADKAGSLAVVQRVLKVDKQEISVDDAVDMVVAKLGEESREKVRSILSRADGDFTSKSLLKYVENRLVEESSGDEESDRDEGESDNEGPAAAASSLGVDEEPETAWRKDDVTRDRRKGGGRKRDTGTDRFKTDPEFRAWVHGLKQKNQLKQYGVRNRTGGHDNLDKKELKILEQAYDRLSE